MVSLTCASLLLSPVLCGRLREGEKKPALQLTGEDFNLRNMPELPSVMWAWSVQADGPPGQALVLSRVPTPPSPPSGTNLLIRVTHAAVNPADLPLFNAWIPFRGRPGFDFIGTVVGVGPKVPVQIKRLMNGEEVVGALGLPQILGGAGALAEYVVAPAELVALKPPALTTTQALGCGVAGQAAVMVVREAAVQPGARVLVNGASGGVGSVLVQVLRAKGAYVVGVCSQRNEELVRKLGAAEVCNPTGDDNSPPPLIPYFF